MSSSLDYDGPLTPTVAATEPGTQLPGGGPPTARQP
jgi:hypothetical protein